MVLVIGKKNASTYRLEKSTLSRSMTLLRTIHVYPYSFSFGSIAKALTVLTFPTASLATAVDLETWNNVKFYNIIPVMQDFSSDKHIHVIVIKPKINHFLSYQALLLFFLFLHENICCEALPMSTYNIYFHVEIKKKNFFLIPPLIWN